MPNDLNATKPGHFIIGCRASDQEQRHGQGWGLRGCSGQDKPRTSALRLVIFNFSKTIKNQTGFFLAAHYLISAEKYIMAQYTALIHGKVY